MTKLHIFILSESFAFWVVFLYSSIPSSLKPLQLIDPKDLGSLLPLILILLTFPLIRNQSKMTGRNNIMSDFKDSASQCRFAWAHSEQIKSNCLS